MAAPNNYALTALWHTDKPRAVTKCQRALAKHNGNRRKAAEELEISLRTLYRWLDDYPEIERKKRGANGAASARAG